MRNLDLTNYPVEVETSTGTETKPYGVKDSIVNLMFHPDLRLGGAELLKQDQLARKVMNCESASILLEEAEYQRIRQAIESFRGFDRHAVEFVRRVLECPEVEVQAKEK